MSTGSHVGSRALIAITLVVFAACAPATDGSPTSSSTPPPEMTTPPTSTIPPDSAALCNSYLVLLRSGDPGPIRQAIDDESVLADIDTMLSSEGEFEAISAAALRVEDHVVSRCTERFTAGLTPAADDAAALSTFMDALGTGDREIAEEVAWANVVAQFTWSGHDMNYEVEGSTAKATLGQDLTVTCRAQRGSVVSCRFGPR